MKARRTAKILLLPLVGVFVIGCGSSPAIRETPAPADDLPERRDAEPERGVEEAPPETWFANEGPHLSPEDVRRVAVRMPVSQVFSTGTEDADVDSAAGTGTAAGTEDAQADSDYPKAHALFKGEVHRYSNERDNEAGFGRFVELSHEFRIELGESIERSRFFTMYGGLSDTFTRPGTDISAGAPIGKVDMEEKSVLIAVYTEDDDPVWRQQTKRPPIKVDGYYFWDPSFVLSLP